MSLADMTTLKNNPLLIGVIVFILLMIPSQFLSYQKYIIDKSKKHKQFIDAANTAKEQLETSLYQSISAIKTLGFIVENYGVPENFDTIAESLIEANKYIDAIQLVNSEGVITHVYPFEENYLALDYNILADNLRNKEAYKTIEMKTAFFAGPFELKQGGMAVVGRQPLFKDTEFIGFSAVIIKLNTLIQATGIDFSSESNFQYQLSKINPDTNVEEFFFPNSESFDKNNTIEIEVPNGAWKLYVTSNNHIYIVSVVLFILLGIVFSTIGAMFAWYIAKQPEVLRGMVDEKTSEIKKVEQRYRSLVENSSHAVIILNAAGGLTYVSPSVKNILGYTEEEAMSLNMFEVLHPDDRAGVEAKMIECLKSPGIPIQGHIARTMHKDGSWRWLDATVTNLLHDPNINGDTIMIEQVFVNLISNAVKYSSKKELQIIEVGAEDKNDAVIFYVKDNGAGFDMAYYDKLFNIFKRLHAPADFDGTGVGLAIVKLVIEKHSGNIWAESRENEGATFFFSIPK
jgi:PAS domain S-box-containing protein